MVARRVEEAVRYDACGAGEVEIPRRVELEEERLPVCVANGEPGRDAGGLAPHDSENAAGIRTRRRRPTGHFLRGHAPVAVAVLEPGGVHHIVEPGDVERLVLGADQAPQTERVAELAAHRRVQEPLDLARFSLSGRLDREGVRVGNRLRSKREAGAR